MPKFLFLSIAGSILLPATVIAASPSEYRTERVSYADLSLLTIAGQKALDRRLVSAAREVCSPAIESELLATLHQSRCMKIALADARMHASQAVAFVQGARPETVRVASR